VVLNIGIWRINRIGGLNVDNYMKYSSTEKWDTIPAAKSYTGAPGGQRPEAPPKTQ